MQIVYIFYIKAFDKIHFCKHFSHKINTVQCANTCAITYVCIYIIYINYIVYINIYICIVDVWHLMALVTYSFTICNDCNHAFTIHGMLWGCSPKPRKVSWQHSSCQEFQNILKFLQHFFVLSHAQNVREKQNLLLLL